MSPCDTGRRGRRWSRKRQSSGDRLLPDVAAPALALGDQKGDVDLVTLGEPMTPDLAELISRALASRSSAPYRATAS
jgi:hypothetical protein